jgi:hypothetical protein
MPRPKFIDVGPALTDEDIDGAEAELGVTFPEPYRRFLLQNNGGRPVPECIGDHPIHTFYGITRDVDNSLILATRLSWRCRLFTNVIPICDTVIGDGIHLGVRGRRCSGRLYFYAHEYGRLMRGVRYVKGDADKRIYHLDEFLEAFDPPDEDNTRNTTGCTL